VAQDKAEPAAPKAIRASADLLHQVIDGKDHFTFPALAGAGGPCNGKTDGAACGEGCTCRGGQPWYDPEGILKLGFRLDAKPAK
jgi:hypothetical protein